MAVSGSELNFYKQVLIKVYELDKVEFLAVKNLLRYFHYDDLTVSMNEKRDAYTSFWDRAHIKNETMAISWLI